jgi:hypothetical protein
MKMSIEKNLSDFDLSSKYWRQNKKRIGQGSFQYVCGFLCKDGHPCQGPPYIWTNSYRKKYKIRTRQTGWSHCTRHITKEEKEELLKE